MRKEDIKTDGEEVRESELERHKHRKTQAQRERERKREKDSERGRELKAIRVKKVPG